MVLIREGGEAMPQTKQINDEPSCGEPKPEKSEETLDMDCEDHLDYCAAVEAIDEALEKGEVRRTRDFARELGFDF
jgi:hypothetical protein